jgi:hypothetical protein
MNKVNFVESENIYRLRVIVTPPKSFLVWTPLVAHRSKIVEFKYATTGKAF